MKKRRRECAALVRPVIVGLFLLLAIPWSVSFAQTITSSGLNTTVSAPIALPSGQTQLNITGGTRPGGGGNLFHSFGNFNVPNNYIANFQNNSGLATSNILGRVTGGNVSNIFGTIQTTGFGNANLFLMNPAGFLFGPNATVNVGGMVAFTSADYLRLADGARFNAIPNAAADGLLSASPVSAFGFLGSNPGAITVQGSQLTVAEGTGISLVGGNITVQGGTLTAPSGQIALVSVNKPTKAGGEIVNGGEFGATGLRSLGTISLTQGSTVDTSGIAGSGHAAGAVSILGGQFVMDSSSIRSVPAGNAGITQINGDIKVTAEQVALSNGSTVTTSTPTGSNHFTGSPGNITFNASTFSATDSAISASVYDSSAPSGAVTIQGLQGSGTSAQTVSIANTTISTSNTGLPSFGQTTQGGPIIIRADDISLNQSFLSSFSAEGNGGPITMTAKQHIDIEGSRLAGNTFFGTGATIDLKAGTQLNLVDTVVDGHSSNVQGGTITMSAPLISVKGGSLIVWSGGISHAGTISLTGTKAVSLNETVLDASNVLSFPGLTSYGAGGTILINGGGLFTSNHSTISAQSALGNGGTVQVQANKVVLTDTQVNTSTSGGPQTVAGHITVDGKQVTLTNSQILSTATEGQGGTINITTKALNQDASSALDASSQFGVDGTVTIQKP